MDLFSTVFHVFWIDKQMSRKAQNISSEKGQPRREPGAPHRPYSVQWLAGPATSLPGHLSSAMGQCQLPLDC